MKVESIASIAMQDHDGTTLVAIAAPVQLDGESLPVMTSFPNEEEAVAACERINLACQLVCIDAINQARHGDN